MLSAVPCAVLLLAAVVAATPTTDQFVERVSESCLAGATASIAQPITDLATALEAVPLALNKLHEEGLEMTGRVISHQDEAAVTLRDGQKRLQKQLEALRELLTPPEPRAEPLVACPYGWTRHGDHCYLVPAGSTAWLTAHAKCAALDSRARLGSVHSDSAAVIESLSDDKFWVGLSQKNGVSPWLWTDGTEVDFTNWDLGLSQPDGPAKTERCGLVSDRAGRGWHDYPCDWEFRYLCQIRVQLQ